MAPLSPPPGQISPVSCWFKPAETSATLSLLVAAADASKGQVEEAYLFSLNVNSGGQQTQLSVTLSSGEMTVLRNLISFSIPHLLGFDMLLGGSDPYVPSAGGQHSQHQAQQGSQQELFGGAPYNPNYREY